MRAWQTLVVALGVGCADKHEGADEEAAPSGYAEFTVTDLTDPAGSIETHWITDNAQWWWAAVDDGEDDVWINHWALHESDNQFHQRGWPQGGGSSEIRWDDREWAVDTFQASTRANTCSEFRKILEQGDALLESVEEGDTTEEHCDALSDFFEQWDARTTLHDDLVTYFSVPFLSFGPPRVGDVEGFEPIKLYQFDRIAKPGDGWDPSTCEYTFTQTRETFFKWGSGPDYTVQIDDVEELVVGTIEADLTSRDGGSMHLEVNFEAVTCQYSGGGSLQVDGERPRCADPPRIVHEEVSGSQSEGTDVLILASVYQDDEDCEGPIQAVTVYYRSMTTPDWSISALTPTTEEAGWQGVIPSVSTAGGMIAYFLTAIDSDSNEGRLPVDSSAFFSFEVSG